MTLSLWRAVQNQARWLNRFRHLLFALVTRSLRRAQTIAVAMDVKGFGLSDKRTYFTQYPSWLPGKIFCWASAAIVIALSLAYAGPGARNLSNP